MGDYNSTLESIKEIINSSNGLYREAYRLYAPRVEIIISSPVLSSEPVEHLLDELFGFCADSLCLGLYKTVCRHLYRYFPEPALFYAKMCIDNYLREEMI